MKNKETIELEYKDLQFTQHGNQRDADDWDEWDRRADWTYEVDKDDLYTFIFESCIDETDFPLAFKDGFDPANEEDWAKFESWLDDNFDEIYAKYEDKILDNWEEDAIKQATQDYDPDDYVNWDSMRGGYDDDMRWGGLNEKYESEPTEQGKEIEIKNFTIMISNPFGNYKLCDWEANSAEEAVAEFKEKNPAYKNKGLIYARDENEDVKEK